MSGVVRDEGERFWSHVIKGPAPEDCWIWVGAISDDGYGRFWIRRDGRQRAVRPSRYAHQSLTGRPLSASVMLLHACDVPLCVHVDANPAVSHLFEGTQRVNMLDREQKHRGGNQWSSLGWRDLSRRQRVARSRELRSVLQEHGWDRARISGALAGVGQNQPRLF